MKYIHPMSHHKTSVSLPQASYRRICMAQKIFARNGFFYSEQEIYRRLFKYFLKNWRGRGKKTNGLRRYNADGKSFSIHPLYINEVLYAALWQRALHSGESISRMLDVAIRVYLPRMLEALLRSPGLPNYRYWEARYQRRPLRYPDFFINYRCETTKNDNRTLRYDQDTQIISKGDCSVMQIWHLLHSAA